MDFTVVNLLYNINSYFCNSTLVPVFVLLLRASKCMQKVDKVPIQIRFSLYTSLTCPSHYRKQSTKQKSYSESHGIFRTLLNLKIYCPCTQFLPRASPVHYIAPYFFKVHFIIILPYSLVFHVVSAASVFLPKYKHFLYVMHATCARPNYLIVSNSVVLL